ncbi:MAG: PadR family transcriptional regulator [Desulfurococcales archaeon ex4484_42]|nr:MAG: PadR family transcriptional regulator [Desulfurococcales archaeon ex4484_42]
MPKRRPRIKAVERFKKKLTIGNLWIYIIKILTLENPLKAYDVKKRLLDLYGIKPATVTVYAVLYKMCREGLIETVRVGGETLYRPTKRGVEALNEARKIIRNIENILE